MKVYELVKLLQELPQDLIVKDTIGNDIDGLHINNEFYNGDYANPDCPVIEVVKLD